MSDEVKPVIKLWTVIFGVFAMVQLSDIETGFKIGLLILTICFTAWQWRQVAKKSRKTKNHEQNIVKPYRLFPPDSD